MIVFQNRFVPYYSRVIERHGVWGVIGVIFAVSLATGSVAFHQTALKLIVYFISVSMLLVITVPHMVTNQKKLRYTGVLFLFIFFVACSALPLLWNLQTYDTPIYLANYGITAVFIFLIVNLVTSRRDLHVMAWATLVLTAILAVLALVEKGDIIEFYGNHTEERVLATMGNPNYLGGFLLMILPIASCAPLSLFFDKLRTGQTTEGRLRKKMTAIVIVSTATIISGVIVLLLTLSRGAWGGALFGWIVFVFITVLISLSNQRKSGTDKVQHSSLWQRKLKRRKLLAIVIAIGAVFLVISVIFLVLPEMNQAATSRISSIFSLFKFDFSTPLIGRISAWKAAVEIWTSAPPLSLVFGRGIGGFYAHVFTHYPADFRLHTIERSFKHAHNEYLELLADGGILTLLAWLFLIFLAVSTSIKVIRSKTANHFHRLIAGALISGLLGMLVHSSVSLVLRTTAIHLLFYVFITLAWVNFKMADPTDGNDGSLVKPISPILCRHKIIGAVLIACTVSVTSVVYCFNYFVSEMNLQNAMKIGGSNARDFDRTRAVQYLKKSLKWNSNNIYSEFELLGLLRGVPPIAFETAERITTLIPTYRNVIMTRGILQASVKNYREAVNDLGYYLKEQDITNKTASAHLLVSHIMLGDADRALAELKLFIERQHRYFQNWRREYLDLEQMDLRFSVTEVVNSKIYDNRTGKTTVVVSVSYLSRLISALLKGRQKGYLDLIPSVYFTVGSLFSEIEYSDVEIEFYELALLTGLKQEKLLNYIHKRCDRFYERVVENKNANMANETFVATDLARSKMIKYLDLMHRIRPDQANLEKMNALTAESAED